MRRRREILLLLTPFLASALTRRVYFATVWQAPGGRPSLSATHAIAIIEFIHERWGRASSSSWSIARDTLTYAQHSGSRRAPA
jgi:hypothetical protein